MPRVLASLHVLAKHLRFLAAIGETKGIEPRDLLRSVNEARQSAMVLRHTLAQLAELQALVNRRTLGERCGTFAANYRGNLRQIATAFEAVEPMARARLS